MAETSPPAAAIVFDNVRKDYRLGRSQYPTLKEWVLSLPKRQGPRRFRALDGVSFSVEQGQLLGLIGENGSGKSTLLKLIAGITAPTSGSIHVHGRVSSLLEIGTGFHPEMTGRENIFLSGALLGIPQETIAAAFDDIVHFAELEEFIDMPVKHYSSGMYMRLGFSVATRIDPDILLIDEVLAVGDEVFQKKSKDVILQMADAGKTLVFVSHDLATVSEICGRCLLVEHGKIVADGPPREAIHEYQKRIFDRKYAETAYRQLWLTRGGNMDLKVTSVQILDAAGRPEQHFQLGRPIQFEIHYECRKRIENACFGISIARDDYVVFSTTTAQCGVSVPPLEVGKGRFRVVLPRLSLLPGIYFVSVVVFPSDILETLHAQKFHEQIYDLHSKLHPFQLEGPAPFRHMEGVAYMEHRWEVPGSEPVTVSLENPHGEETQTK